MEASVSTRDDRQGTEQEASALDTLSSTDVSATSYGTAEVSESGVDISQLRRNRLLSPTERAEQMAHAANILRTLQGMARRRKA